MFLSQTNNRPVAWLLLPPFITILIFIYLFVRQGSLRKQVTGGCVFWNDHLCLSKAHNKLELQETLLHDMGQHVFTALENSWETLQGHNHPEGYLPEYLSSQKPQRHCHCHSTLPEHILESCDLLSPASVRDMTGILTTSKQPAKQSAK